jgi:hypothetical protein
VIVGTLGVTHNGVPASELEVSDNPAKRITNAHYISITRIYWRSKREDGLLMIEFQPVRAARAL